LPASNRSEYIKAMRICSFLPSATEILYALGLGDCLAGVTYECDYPPEVREKPAVVNTRLPRTSSPNEVDRLVSESIARGESLYRIETHLLREIQPDLIVTQDLCRVCAASPGDLDSAIAMLPCTPRVLSLNPRTLADVWNDIQTVGEATGRGREAAALVSELEQRVTRVEQAVSTAPHRPRTLCLEWLDPPFVAGHWVPDMVSRAGGYDVLGQCGEPGFRVDWDKVSAAQPEVVVIMPCGYHLEETVAEVQKMPFPPAWQSLPAVRQGQVFAVDASSYFSRPGPRLAIGVEILASVVQPKLAPVEPPVDAVEHLN
jgi:iron complex transport system substrate-binding protein